METEKCSRGTYKFYQFRVKACPVVGAKSPLEGGSEQCQNRCALISWKSFFSLLIAVLVSGACSSQRSETTSQVRKDPWGKPERFSVGKDKDGNPVMKSDLRSGFEGKQSHMASSRDFSGKDYQKKSYARKRWGGNTTYERKKYGGNTDASRYKMEPWFVQKQAGEAATRANADGKAYTVNPYGKSTAREQGATRLEHDSDAETDLRRRVYKQPDIIDWEEQKDLSVQDTNRLLGR